MPLKRKNDLKLLRRHISGCQRFPGGTFQPVSKKDVMADKCLDTDGRKLSQPCPIWARGYLVNEPKRVRVSLGCTDWIEAQKALVALYEVGSLPKSESATKTVDPFSISVGFAVKRYLDSTDRNIIGVAKPLAKDTHDHYKVLLNRRLLSYCGENQITLVRDFGRKDVCRQFVESWRQFRRNIGHPLGTKTKETERARFSAFLNFCVENGWLDNNGVKHLPVGKTVRPVDPDDDGDEEDSESGIRYGLELPEYMQLLDASDSDDLTAQGNQETRAVVELMGENGLRVADAHKFNLKEIVRNETGNGWNAHYKQKKNGRWCTSPLSDDLVAKLNVLPGRIEKNKKYFFTCSYSALRERVMALAKRAQREKPFAHHFSPHCLRHTFAVHHLYVLGDDVSVVSKWLGHKSTAVTIKYYSTWIKGTHVMAEEISRKGNIKTKKMMAAIRVAALKEVA